MNKILRNLSKRAGAMLVEDMEFMGPVRLKDVEAAQQRIVNVIRTLEEAGEIVIVRGGEDELVV
jgi:flagellar motor switch protein FliG